MEEELIIKIFSNGTREFRLPNGFLHRADGGAAIEFANGDQVWYLHGQIHRIFPIGAPSRIDHDGTMMWYDRGRLHRVDGPAIHYSTGIKEWWKEGRRYYCPIEKDGKMIWKEWKFSKDRAKDRAYYKPHVVVIKKPKVTFNPSIRVERERKKLQRGV